MNKACMRLLTAPLLAVAIFGLISEAGGATTGLTRADFLAAFPEHSAEGFNETAVGTQAPFTVSGGFTVLGSLAEVLVELVDLGNEFWFDGNGLPPNFLIVNDAELILDFDDHLQAFGIELSCFACGPDDVRLDLLDSAQVVVGSFTRESPFSPGSERFIGASSNVAFRRVRIVRNPGGDGFGNWLVDAARWVTADGIFRDRFEPRMLAPGDTFKDCPDCPTMVVIPGGSFVQGSPASDPDSWDIERPQRTVNLPTFAIGRTAVTFAQWDACVADGGCQNSPDDDGWGRGNRPVIDVSWNDAQQYVTWLSNRTGQEYRLPSESEWEYATRAGTTGRFNTGDCITTEQANFDGRSPAQDCPMGVFRGQSLPVGTFAPNPFGLYDTHGNVAEWVQDCWNPNYDGAPTDGSAWMMGECSLAMLRGGSWASIGTWVRSAERGWLFRSDRGNFTGFRVARPVDL